MKEEITLFEIFSELFRSYYFIHFLYNHVFFNHPLRKTPELSLSLTSYLFANVLIIFLLFFHVARLSLRRFQQSHKALFLTTLQVLLQALLTQVQVLTLNLR